MNQNTSSIIMIRPKHFDFNKETASNNYFQKDIDKVFIIGHLKIDGINR